MTIPTEEEIVARAMWDAYQTSPCVTEASKGISWDTIRKNVDTNEGAEAFYKTGIQEAKAAISALDSHRAKNAGEIEQALRYIDADHCEHEPHVVLRWLEKAAALISTLRSAIAEKDEALDRIAQIRGYDSNLVKARDIASTARSRISEGEG